MYIRVGVGQSTVLFETFEIIDVEGQVHESISIRDERGPRLTFYDTLWAYRRAELLLNNYYNRRGASE